MNWTRAEHIPSTESLGKMLDLLDMRDPRLLAAIAGEPAAPGHTSGRLSAIEHPLTAS